METDTKDGSLTARWRRVAFPVLALAVILLLASTLSSVINPVLVGVLLAVILNPVVNFASRFRLPRVVTVSVLYALLLLLSVLFAAVLVRQFQELGSALSGEPFLGDYDGNGLIELGAGPSGRDEYQDLNGNGVYDPGALLRLKNWLDTRIAGHAEGVLGDALDEARRQLVDVLTQFAKPAGDMIGQSLERVTAWAGGLFGLITLMLLIPFYTFFFVVEYPAMSARLRKVVPPRYREQVHRITTDIGKEMVTFFRGRLLCGMVKALLLFIGMLALGIEFALPIALVTGLLSLVPFVGFVAGVMPASIIALTMPGGGTDKLLWVVGLFAAGEAIEGGILFPLLLGKETGLHPVALVVVLLAGGSLMGTLGVIVAIPLALICKVLWRELGQPLYREWAATPPARHDADA